MHVMTDDGEVTFFGKNDNILSKFLNDSYYLNEAGKKITHYTSVESFYQIISSGCLRAGSARFMNDPMDSNILLYSVVRVIFNSIDNYSIKERASEIVSKHELFFDRSLSAASRIRFDGLSEGVQRKLADFLYYLDIEVNLKKNFPGAYFISFAKWENRDDLNFWRSYGDDGYGVGIELDCDHFTLNLKKAPDEKLSCGVFLSCVYKSMDEILELSKNIVEEILRRFEYLVAENFDSGGQEMSSLLTRLLLASSVVKSDGYRSENEVRFVPLEGLMNRMKTKFLARRGAISNFIDVEFSKDSLCGLLFGPNFHAGSMKIILNFLVDSGVNKSIKVFHYYNSQDINVREWGVLVRKSNIQYLSK